MKASRLYSKWQWWYLYSLHLIWACCSANNKTCDWNDWCACALQVHILVTFQTEEIRLMSYTFTDQKRAADLHCLGRKSWRLHLYAWGGVFCAFIDDKNVRINTIMMRQWISSRSVKIPSTHNPTSSHSSLTVLIKSQVPSVKFPLKKSMKFKFTY